MRLNHCKTCNSSKMPIKPQICLQEMKFRLLWAESRPGVEFALLSITGQPSLVSFPMTQEDKS